VFCGDPSSLLKTAKHAPIFGYMYARGLIRVVPLFMVCIPTAFGQLPKRVEKCLPYPTLAQEIREMRPADPAPPRVRVRVIRVEFDSKDDIPPDVREEISAELQSHVFERDADAAHLDDLANEIAEVNARGTLQDRGYFTVMTAAKLVAIQVEGGEVSVAAIISAKTGPQYRAGDIRIESADSDFQLSMSPEVLRGFIPLQRGELFDVERLRTGLKNLALAYGREGYVDMNTEPDFQIDDAHETIDMVLKIDQQAQYRVGTIEMLGVSLKIREKLMESLPKSGEIFDGTRLEEFFKVNQAFLPPDVSRDDVNVRRDPKTKTVAILFDFRTCRPNSN
jgi:outer membrane protein assembly factor BamA